jgi:hypothetical protein
MQAFNQQIENTNAMETQVLTKITPQQALITPHPPLEPTKTDILIDIINEREQLKALREQLKAGTRRASKTLNMELYLTQLILSANKIALIGIKETNINLTQNNYVDISAQVNELIKFSRERQCNRSKPTGTS